VCTLNEALLNQSSDGSLPIVPVLPTASPTLSHMTAAQANPFVRNDRVKECVNTVANYTMRDLHLVMMNSSGIGSSSTSNTAPGDSDTFQYLVALRYFSILNNPSRAKGHDLFVAISKILGGGYSDLVKMMALLFSRDFSQKIDQLPLSHQAMYCTMLLQLWDLLRRLETAYRPSTLIAQPDDTLDNTGSLHCDYQIDCHTDGEFTVAPTVNPYQNHIVLLKKLVAQAFTQLSVSVLYDHATGSMAASIFAYHSICSSTVGVGSRLQQASKFSYAVTYFIAVLKLIQSRVNNFRLWGFRGYDVGLNAALVAGVAYSNPVVSLIQRILAVLVYIPLLFLRLFNACEVDDGGEYLKIRRGQMANDAMWGAVALLSIAAFVWLMIVSGGLAGVLAVGVLPFELKAMLITVSILNIFLYFYDLFILVIWLKREEVKHMKAIITELHMEQDINNDDNLLLLCDDLSKSAQKIYNISWKKALALLIGKLCFIALIVIAEATLTTSVITLLVWLAVAGAVIMFAANCWFWWYYERKQTRMAGCAAWQPSHIWCDITGLYYQRHITLARQWIEEKQRQQAVADQLTQQARGIQVREDIKQQWRRIDSEIMPDKREREPIIIA
jgi:hypothetical protein